MLTYDQHILSAALEYVASINITKENPTYEDVLKHIFNIEVFNNESYAMQNGLSLYLLSDDTIIQMLRTTINENPFAKEWLARQYKKKALWKTPAEYNRLFARNKGNINEAKINNVLQRLGLSAADYYLEEVEYEPYAIPENQVWFFINDEIVDANDIISKTLEPKSSIYYLYVDAEKLDNREKIISGLKRIS